VTLENETLLYTQTLKPSSTLRALTPIKFSLETLR
jgi:hypothetical protein